MNLFELFDYDPLIGSLTWKNGRAAGTKNHGLRVAIEGKRHLATDLIWQIMTGEAPPRRVEHINGNSYDLRWSNLRAGSGTPKSLQELMDYDPIRGALTWKQGGKVGSFNSQTGMEYATLNGTRYELCDLVWLYVYGELPPTTITFKDGDALNYAILNLVPMEGTTKTRRRKGSKHNGIYWLSGEHRWKVRVTYKDGVYPLGWYDQIDRARAARTGFNADAEECIKAFKNNPEEWLAAFNKNPTNWSTEYWNTVIDRLGREGGLDYYVPG